MVSTYVLGDLDEQGNEIEKGDRRLTGGVWEARINIASNVFALWNGLLSVLWLWFKWGIEYQIKKEDYLLKNPSFDESGLSLGLRI